MNTLISQLSLSQTANLAVLFSLFFSNIFFQSHIFIPLLAYILLGYHACRMLAASTDIATVIGTGIRENHEPDQIAAAAYQEIWGKQNRGQRDFQVTY